MADKKVKSITSKSENIAKWYTDVCTKAELRDYAQAKGFIIYRPDGYALWEGIQSYFDKRIKQLGVKNVYLPSLIPRSLLEKEEDFIKGFAPECAVVTRGGSKDLSEPFVVRPTSETLFCDHFKDIVHSYNDLPVKYNQWCSVVRWEKTTRPFLRGSEFLWQEGHTLHESENEAREFALSILRLYNEMGRDLLAIPFVRGKKPESEKFAGAVDTYTIEALRPDGQALQCGTTHYLGQNFCKAYNIRYLNKENQICYPHYTSWGRSTRLIGALIRIHGDDEGLVLPPMIAPTQVRIIPIRADKDKRIRETANQIKDELAKQGVRIEIDSSDKTPGWKFSQYERKGIPLRIEIGPKDIEKGTLALSIRYSGEKKFLAIEEAVKEIPQLLKEIQEGRYQKALAFLNSHIHEVHSYEEIKQVVTTGGGFAKTRTNHQDEAEDEAKLKADFNATPRVMPFNQEAFDEKDALTGNKADHVVYFARAY